MSLRIDAVKALQKVETRYGSASIAPILALQSSAN